MESKFIRSINQLETGFRKYSLKLLIPFLASILLTGCGVVEGIFETGLWFGIIITVAIIVLLIWGIVKIIQKMK